MHLRCMEIIPGSDGTKYLSLKRNLFPRADIISCNFFSSIFRDRVEVNLTE